MLFRVFSSANEDGGAGQGAPEHAAKAAEKEGEAPSSAMHKGNGVAMPSLSDARLGIVAALLGILGLMSLYYFENAAAAREIDISDVKYARQGELVKFEGTIAKITMKEDGATLQSLLQIASEASS